MFGTSGFTWGKRDNKGVQVIFIVTIVSYIAQIVIDRFTAGFYTKTMGLSWNGILGLKAWQFVSYQFVHGSIVHLLVNMFMLAVFGREVEDTIGTFRFVMLYLLSRVTGGTGWLLISGMDGYQVCIGASGSLFGIAGAFAAMFPNREIYLLLFFILPLKMTARMMAVTFGLISLVITIIGGGDIAHAAHLAGGVAGYAYGSFLKKRGVLYSRPPRISELFRRWTGLSGEPPLESEVNSVLDKITREGMASLTSSERVPLS